MSKRIMKFKLQDLQHTNRSFVFLSVYGKDDISMARGCVHGMDVTGSGLEGLTES